MKLVIISYFINVFGQPVTYRHTIYFCTWCIHHDYYYNLKFHVTVPASKAIFTIKNSQYL